MKKFIGKFSVLMIIVVSIFIIFILGLYFFIPKIADVDEVSIYTKDFKGSIGVLGIVGVENCDRFSKLFRDDESKFFMLYDRNRYGRGMCWGLLVKYKGKRQMPEVESEIIVYGEVKAVQFKKDKMKSLEYHNDFILEVNEYKAKNDDLKGNSLYWTRKELKKLRHWLYVNCKKCIELKRRLLKASIDDVMNTI